MKKMDQLGIRWEEDVKARWERLAQQRFRRGPSVLARAVLEEFLACFLEDKELSQLGLIGCKPPNLIAAALNAPAMIESGTARSSRISAETEELLFTALRAILDRAPSTVIEDLAARLSDAAGRYAEPRVTPRRPARK
ncbi:MAG: hypothetical protein ACLP1Y_04295 [Candidatus Acidiferrales bacterium]